MQEATQHRLRIAGVPAHCITLLPPLPLDEDALYNVCKSFAAASDAAGWASARNDIYFTLENEDSHDTKKRSKSEKKQLTKGGSERMMDASPSKIVGSGGASRADQVVKIARLVCSMLPLSNMEYAQRKLTVPLLQLAEIASICDRLRSEAELPVADEDLAATRELSRYATASASPSSAAKPRGRPRKLDVSAVSQLPQLPDEHIKFEVGGEGDTPMNADIEPGTEIVDETEAGAAAVADGSAPKPAVYLSEKDYEIISHEGIFFEDEDSRLGKTGLPQKIGAILLRNAIPDGICRRAARCLEPAATTQNLRAKTNGGVPPETGVVGFYDYLNNANPRKCRETQYTRQHWPEMVNDCAPMLKTLNAVYERAAPAHFRLQQAVIPPQFRLFGTAFSTLTVNHSFRTAMHTDKGDFKNGLGVVAVIDGNYSGCHLAIPKLKKAFKLQIGDVLLFDTSLPHGNTEAHAPDGMWTRTSVVAYLRTGLFSQRCEMENRMRINRAMAPHIERALFERAEGGFVVNINAAAPGQPPIYLPSRLIPLLTPVQEAALSFASRRLTNDTGCIVAMSMGLGKTLVALCAAFSHLIDNPKSDIVILTPKTVIPHWVDEAQKWSQAGGLVFDALCTPLDQNLFDEEVLRFNQQASGETTKVGHVFIINPEGLRSLMRRCPQLVPSMIIVDEGHKVSSRDSKFRQALQSLLVTNKRIVLSGTPIQNNVEELFLIVDWIAQDALFVAAARDSLTAHGQCIEQFVAGDDSLLSKATCSLQFVMEWAKAYVFRVTDESLPPISDFLLLCGSSATQNDFFLRHDLRNACASLRAMEHRPSHLSCHPAALALFRCRAMSGGVNPKRHVPKRPRASPAGAVADSDDSDGCNGRDMDEQEDITDEADFGYLEWVEQSLTAPDMPHIHNHHQAGAVPSPLLQSFADIPEHIARFLKDSGKLTATVAIVLAARAKSEKVIVFAQYILVQELILRALTAAGINCAFLRGKDLVSQRTEVVGQFTSDPRTSALVVSTRVGAFGIEITAACHVILFDSWWNPQVDAQAIARAHRRNQRKPVTVYRLLSQREDMAVVRAQQRKMALFRSVLESKTTQAASLSTLGDCSNSDPDETRRDELWPLLKSIRLNDFINGAAEGANATLDSSGEGEEGAEGHREQEEEEKDVNTLSCVSSIHWYDSIMKPVS